MIDPKVFKQVRKALGLTQAELADALGLSRVTINKMERGRLKNGIPDEIGDRLMSLKLRRPDVKAQLAARDTPVLAGHVARDDSHLWDNEEDE